MPLFNPSEDQTIISTNAGDMGNAHSEFIGPLAEMGILGPITFILIIVVFYFKSANLYYSLPRSELRSIVFWVSLAFTTYIINGTLNNFLDTDKASVPFWSFIANYCLHRFAQRTNCLRKKSKSYKGDIVTDSASCFKLIDSIDQISFQSVKVTCIFHDLL